VKKSSKKTVTKTIRENVTSKKDTAPVATTEPIKKSRGGIHNYSETKANTVERVRGEFLSDTFKAKVTFTYTTITFNTACVNLFKNCQHVTLSIDTSTLRIFVESTTDYDKNGVKFANVKNGKNVPRTSTTRWFCLKLFDFMQWNPNTKYRILTIYQEFGEKKVLVFNLDEAQQVFSEVIESEDGKKKSKPTVQMPPNWKDRFGYKMDELDEKMRVERSSTLLTIDHKTGEWHTGSIEPQPPTPENLIHEQYGGIRPRKEAKNE
jgi:hypothetical protein